MFRDGLCEIFLNIHNSSFFFLTYKSYYTENNVIIVNRNCKCTVSSKPEGTCSNVMKLR